MSGVLGLSRCPADVLRNTEQFRITIFSRPSISGDVSAARGKYRASVNSGRSQQGNNTSHTRTRTVSGVGFSSLVPRRAASSCPPRCDRQRHPLCMSVAAGMPPGQHSGSHAAQKLQRRECLLAAPTGTPQLTCLTFNVLADGLAQDGGFIRAPAAALQWEHRRRQLLAEILEADADIVCLQELNHFEDFLQPELAARGYEGHFFGKCTSPATQYGCPPDGSALFIRSARLGPVQPAQGTAFQDVAGAAVAQGMQCWRLRDQEAGRDVVAATFHLKAKAGTANDSIRQHQAQQAADVLAAAAAPLQPPGNGSPPCSVAVILCGDMNATPDSAACQTLRQHSVALLSLWDREAPGEQETFTTWKFRADGESRRIIDHVWHSAELQPCARWLTPSREEIGPNALPNLQYPSDHIAVRATLQWRP